VIECKEWRDLPLEHYAFLQRGGIEIGHPGLGSLEYELGGTVYIIEKYSEVDSITTMDGISLREKPGTFDMCERYGDFWYVMLCTTDSGGNIFIVPASLRVLNLLKSTV